MTDSRVRTCAEVYDFIDQVYDIGASSQIARKVLEYIEDIIYSRRVGLRVVGIEHMSGPHEAWDGLVVKINCFTAAESFVTIQFRELFLICAIAQGRNR